jgi:hypothetical protein
MKTTAILVGAAVGLAGMVLSETVTNNLDVQGGFIYNHGAINPADVGLTFTNVGVRDVTVSAGQLSGVDPETGSVITNSANLLPLKAQSLTTVSNIVAGGTFVGNGSGLTNLNANSFSGVISASSLPTSGFWNASGVTITNVSLAGNVAVNSLTVATNLTVQGTISGDGSGLIGVTAGAGGSDGSFQFNNNGVLSGDTNFFIHPTEHKPAFRSPSGNFFRGYNSETISDSNLIYSVRNEDGTSVLRLRQNGEDSIRLSGDGTAYIKGNLQLDGQLIADGSGITNLPVQAQVDALIAAVSNSPAATITTNQIASWNSGGALAGSFQVSTGVVNITTNLMVQGTICGNGAGLTDLTLNGVALETIISNLQQSVSAYSNTVCVTVQVADNEATNGLNLIAAYAQAKTLSPSATNRIAVIVPSGRYDLGTTGLQINTPYIDLIGQTTDCAAQYLFGAPGANNGVVKQSADYVRIENLTILNQSPAVNWDGSDPAAYFPTTQGNNTVVRNCIFAGEFSMRLEVEYAGRYENCASGDYSFGLMSTASGVFIDCQGGWGSFGGFGGNASGTFVNCTAGDDAFGGWGTAGGTFTHCQSGNESFGSFGEASGTFTDCRAKRWSFGGGGGVLTTSAVLVSCTAEAESFGIFNMAATNFNSALTLGGVTRTAWPSGDITNTVITNTVMTTFTYVPPQGDLSMGVYTNGPH